jgi:hypothetical protein
LFDEGLCALFEGGGDGVGECGERVEVFHGVLLCLLMMACAPGVSGGGGPPCSAAVSWSMAMMSCVISIVVVVEVVGCLVVGWVCSQLR